MGNKKTNSTKRKLLLSIVSTIVVVLLVGAGLVGYRVEKALDREIYGTPRAEVGDRNPEDLGLSYRSVKFRSSNGLELRGWFVEGSSSKCVILAPGKGANRWKLLDYAPFLHEAGYDILLFDPRGTGKSEGEKWGFGYLESRDILEAVDFLRENFEVKEFGVLGRSAGGAAALMAALEGSMMDAVVADSPFASIKLASESYGNYENNPLFDVIFPIYAAEATRRLGFDVIKKCNLKKRIKNLRTPVFFIHGKSDQVLYPKNTEVLYANKSGEKKLWKPEEIGHVGGFEERTEQYKRKVVDFFNRYL